MGEREIVETVSVTQKEDVFVCDFCGRSSDELDEEFISVFVNPNMTTNLLGHSNKTSEGVEYLHSLSWYDTEKIEVQNDDRMHYCNECHAAHVEVHNDDC
jgi:protein-arginine kinase activator protein McsA